MRNRAVMVACTAAAMVASTSTDASLGAGGAFVAGAGVGVEVTGARVEAGVAVGIASNVARTRASIVASMSGVVPGVDVDGAASRVAATTASMVASTSGVWPSGGVDSPSERDTSAKTATNGAAKANLIEGLYRNGVPHWLLQGMFYGEARAAGKLGRRRLHFVHHHQHPPVPQPLDIDATGLADPASQHVHGV